jgi:hypothetical protein
MPTFSTVADIQQAIQLFNKHAYNAALGFKVYSSEASCLYIQASFDFSYYVNVDIECREVLFTNIRSDASWPDAWHNDQLFLLSDEELGDIIHFHEIDIKTDKAYFGIVFNIIGKDNYFINGTVICTSLYINWRNSNKNDAYAFHTSE